MMLFGLFRKKQSLDAADLSQQNLRDIPVSLYEHKRTLQKLYLNRNFLRDFPKGILRFEGLTELDLSDNELLFLPPTIGHFQHLKVLNLSYNNLPTIPDGIQNCEELISINLNSNPLGRICEGIANLKQLRHLKLNDCELDSLPNSIGKLSKLETLELRDNRLQELPSSIGELRNLEKLDLGINELEILPPEIGCLISLVELWIDNNILLSFPEEIGMLINLIFLEASENRLIDLPMSFGDLCSLNDLYLNDNLLSDLPASFGNLHSLQTCKLCINRITTLPDTLTGLHSLFDLDISHNFLTELPGSLCTLPNLMSLNLNENTLVELPNEIGSCLSLSVLSLRNNKLTVIPLSITQLKNLRVLTVVGNRLTHLPFGILGIKSLKAIWVAENQIRPMLEFQTQEDPESGEKWTTCVVFPQKEPKPSNDESDISSGSDLTMVEKDVPVHNHHLTSVNFQHTETEEKKSTISRDVTPYPKDLKDKVRKWKKSRDLLELDSEPYNTDDGANNTVKLRHSSPKKLNRPYSFLKALNNPVQDSNGFIKGSCSHDDTTSQDLDLLMSLPLSEIAAKTGETSCNSNDNMIDDSSRNISVSPSLPVDVVPETDYLSANSNSNNNTPESQAHSMDIAEPHYQKPCSVISDSSSVLSSKLSKYMREGIVDHDCLDNGQNIPAWYLSLTPSPHHPSEMPESSVDMIEKMETEECEFMTRTTYSPPPQDIMSPPALVSPISGISSYVPTEPISFTRNADDVFSTNAEQQLVDSQYGSPYTSHYQSPLCLSNSVDSHYDYVRTKHRPSLRKSSLGQGWRDKDFAIEYNLQTQLRPEVVHTTGVSAVEQSTEHIYSQPRTYKGNCSGHNTPETPRISYKSLSSLCDSGIESIRRPTPIGGYLSRSASTGMGLDSHCGLSSSRTYEVTLRKNPALGLAITGGKDGENALYPHDKGFHVFRLVDGMPASTCGKINIGDRIVEVNGIGVNNLTNAQIIKLLTAPEPYVTILFARQPSMTLI